MTRQEAVKLHNTAQAIGRMAGRDHTPTPMQVGGYTIPDGPCGFAWVRVKCTGKGAAFINGLKKEGLASANINCFDPKVVWERSTSQPGYMFWVSDFGQSYERKLAMARAMGNHLREAGLPAHAGGRLD